MWSLSKEHLIWAAIGAVVATVVYPRVRALI